jgi:O-acetyl-ADP-ribose deacetylase (regulator of RNase III)
MGIEYVTGDATAPGGTGPKVVVHVCNDIGGWGRGFVKAVSARWLEPELEYREWFRSGDGFELGAVRLVPVGPELWVANLIGQHGIQRDTSGATPVRYGAIERGLSTLAGQVAELGASVHMPRIGAGLAGGRWAEIEPIIERTLVAAGLSVTVYDLP